MSIENTFQSAVRLCEGYLGLVDQSAIFFEETAVSKLSDRLHDDLSLRKFFVANSFPDLFRQSARKDVCRPLDIDSSIHKFVRSTYIFPDLWCSSHDNSLMKFFIDMCTHASRIFGRELDRDFQEGCQKAEDLGIFIPIMRIEEDREGIHLVAARTEVTFGEQVGIFYKISEALFELWIKHEDKGKMLEAWSYNIIKKYFAKTNYIVFPNLHIRQDRTPEDAQSLDELASRFAGAVPGSYCDYEIGEVDGLIQKEGKIVALIECKMDKDVGRSD
ncbi:MAG: hypothetical protein PHW87_07875 [Methanothrix sp.]|nr:hypothetical protein [Methanothrix sp.]